MAEQEIGFIMHYFGKASVVAITLKEDLAVGDTIHIKGSTTDFITKVESMQVDREEISNAVAGQSVGLKVPELTRQNDKVFKVV